ncbi:MAG: hypothetical protein WBD14_01490 [Phycisphaerae bacterium]
MQILAQSRTVQQVPYSHIAYGAAAGESSLRQSAQVAGGSFFGAILLVTGLIVMVGVRKGRRARASRHQGGERVAKGVLVAFGLFVMLAFSGLALYFACDGRIAGTSFKQAVPQMAVVALLALGISLMCAILAAARLLRNPDSPEAITRKWKRILLFSCSVLAMASWALSVCLSVYVYGEYSPLGSWVRRLL